MPNQLKLIRDRIRCNFRRSMRKIAKKIEISELHIRNIVKNQLKLKSFKLQDFCKAHFSDFVRPIYISWTKRQRLVPHNSVDSLMRNLVKAWNEIDENTMNASFDQFPRSLTLYLYYYYLYRSKWRNF